MKYSDLNENQKFELLRNEYINDGAQENDAEDTALNIKESSCTDQTLREVFGYTNDTEIEKEDI